MALIGADRHCSEMETRNKILEGQVCRLWGGWSRKGRGILVDGNDDNIEFISLLTLCHVTFCVMSCDIPCDFM